MIRGQVFENQSAALLASIPDVRGGWPAYADIVSLTFTVIKLDDDTQTYRASTTPDSDDETLVLDEVMYETPQVDLTRWKEDTGFNVEIIAPGECWEEPGTYAAEIVVVTTDEQTLTAQWLIQAKKMYSI